MLLRKTDIHNLERKYRLNLINSITGIKPANLVGTTSLEGRDNLAIFSSLVHLGSNPAQLGLVMRPQTHVKKDTYTNITNTGYYTINHITESFTKKAHYTSAKLEHESSEFDVMHIKREHINGFKAPFVASSPIKIGMSHLETLKLPNGCLFIVGEIVLIQYPDEVVNHLGQVKLDLYKGVGIGGLNNYYQLKKIASYPYVRVDEIPDFND